LYEIISSGLIAYHQTSLQTMEELPSQRVWSEYIFADYSVDQEKLAAIAEDLMFFIETHYYQRALRPEVPGVLETIRKIGLKIGLIVMSTAAPGACQPAPHPLADLSLSSVMSPTRPSHLPLCRPTCRCLAPARRRRLHHRIS
jgi:hypothetical protein